MTAADTRPIFVIGYMHSGTTLLLNVLGRHSEVHSSAGETRFFEQLARVREAFPNLTDPKQAADFAAFVSKLIPAEVSLSRAIDSVAPEHGASLVDLVLGRDYGEAFRAVFDELTRRAGKRRWLEKTPTHVFHVDEVARSIPDARFVEIVRDLRDVLASKKTRRATVWSTNRYRPDQRAFKHMEKAYDPLWDTLSWKAAIQAGLQSRARHGDRFHTVRYEDLVRDPELAVRRICGFVGLDFEADMLDIRFRNAAEVDASAIGISSDSVGRWTRVLDPGEIALCQWLAGAEMTAHEYRPAEPGRAASLRVPLHLMSSGYGLGMRLMRRWRMGGTPFLLSVLSGYATRAKKLFWT